MTPALAKVRELVERHLLADAAFLADLKRLSAKATNDHDKEQVRVADELALRMRVRTSDLSALLPELEAQIERLEKALHPGTAGLAPVRRNSEDKWESWRAPLTDHNDKDRADAWCDKANLYEATTGKRLGEGT